LEIGRPHHDFVKVLENPLGDVADDQLTKDGAHPRFEGWRNRWHYAIRECLKGVFSISQIANTAASRSCLFRRVADRQLSGLSADYCANEVEWTRRNRVWEDESENPR
jgi:hypothetical protein